MSLYIDTDTVTDVLLADGWHEVTGSSFRLDSYEYHYRDRMMLSGGVVNGVVSTGFSFRTGDGNHLSGPLTALLAVKHRHDLDV